MDSLIDWLGCALFRLLGPVFRSMPVAAAFFIGRRLGDVLYACDGKHRRRVFDNLKTAFGRDMDIPALRRLTLDFYRTFGQNAIEIFLIPRIDGSYVAKYVAFEGKEYIDEAFKSGKGVIFVGVHAGSWELSNSLSTAYKIPFSMFVREQKLPRLNVLLNEYRRQKGARLIRKEDQMREMIRVLRANESFGMSADQGGRSGVLVPFLGRDASMASGAVKLAMRYGCAIVPFYCTRVSGPYIKLFLRKPVTFESADGDSAVTENLRRLIEAFEDWIRRYPKDYLWTYRVWKYSRARTVMIVSDGKTGHLRQSQAVASLAAQRLKDRGYEVREVTVELGFLPGAMRAASFAVQSRLSNNITCGQCLECLRGAVTPEAFKALTQEHVDVVVSCGSSVAPVNRLISLYHGARSIAIMRPVMMGWGAFDLVVALAHDHPPSKAGVVETQGAMNLVTPGYLEANRRELLAACPGLEGKRIIGCLLGGDTKDFIFEPGAIETVLQQLKKAAEQIDGYLAVTTSRRTSAAVEAVVKKELAGYSRCPLLIVARENNVPYAVGGILAVSSITVVSPESISMVSEAASSGAYVVVFDLPGLRLKFQEFLAIFSRKKYIMLVGAEDLSAAVHNIWYNKPQRAQLADRQAVSEALARIL